MFIEKINVKLGGYLKMNLSYIMNIGRGLYGNGLTSGSRAFLEHGTMARANLPAKEIMVPTLLMVIDLFILA